jgi:hypothetical protein
MFLIRVFGGDFRGCDSEREYKAPSPFTRVVRMAQLVRGGGSAVDSSLIAARSDGLALQWYAPLVPLAPAQ